MHLAGHTYPVMRRPFLGTGSAYPLESADNWSEFLTHRSGLIVRESTVERPLRKRVRADVRSAKEHLQNIRVVLNPAIGDLATLCDVSRQAVYKWLAEESTPDPEKLERIRLLSQIADEFKSKKVERASTLLKMKAFGERSLFDILRSGDDSSAAVQALIEEASAMEQSYANSRIARTRAPATEDWRSDVSIPHTSEDH